MTEFLVAWTKDVPLYEQLYRYVVDEIRAGRLVKGEKLPSRRRLAQHLGVSLTTVERAYALLTAEGYAAAAPRSGYRVEALAELPAPSAPAPAPHPAEERALDDCFSTAAVDTSVFPFTTWARLAREAVYENPDLLQRGDGQGDWPLRAALADFLREYRGVRCRPEQVVIGAGLEYLIGVVLQLLPPETVLALEDPGYAALWRTVENFHRPCVSVPVDGRGMDPLALAESGADAAYVTPSHQFPLGVATPIGRRTELLRWAYEKPGRWLIEDDYDSEFRYTSRPIPAMQGQPGGERVIYLGTFSRTVAPSIRVAYLILPEELLGRYRERFTTSTVSRFEQETLRRFLATGRYGRHLRRVGNLYRERRDALVAALDARFPSGAVSGAGAGLHLLFSLPGREEKDLVDRAAEAGYRIRGLSEYCRQAACPPGTVVLGFAGLPADRAETAAAELLRAFG